jgi:hypothetical protein
VKDSSAACAMSLSFRLELMVAIKLVNGGHNLAFVVAEILNGFGAGE